jgi:hypothetical protein
LEIVLVLQNLNPSWFFTTHSQVNTCEHVVARSEASINGIYRHRDDQGRSYGQHKKRTSRTTLSGRFRSGVERLRFWQEDLHTIKRPLWGLMEPMAIKIRHS